MLRKNTLQEREKEAVQLEGQASGKKEEFQVLSGRVENYGKGMENLKDLDKCLEASRWTAFQNRQKRHSC